MIPKLLIIDDDPYRYDYFQTLTSGRVDLVQVGCVSCIDEALTSDTEYAAVLLDYDLNGPDFCKDCGDNRLRKQGDSRKYLKAIAALEIPVIVTSGSLPENRTALVKGLRSMGVQAVQLSAVDVDPEIKWLGQLWVWDLLSLTGKRW